MMSTTGGKECMTVLLFLGGNMKKALLALLLFGASFAHAQAPPFSCNSGSVQHVTLTGSTTAGNYQLVAARMSADKRRYFFVDGPCRWQRRPPTLSLGW